MTLFLRCCAPRPRGLPADRAARGQDHHQVHGSCPSKEVPEPREATPVSQFVTVVREIPSASATSPCVSPRLRRASINSGTSRLSLKMIKTSDRRESLTGPNAVAIESFEAASSPAAIVRHLADMGGLDSAVDSGSGEGGSDGGGGD